MDNNTKNINILKNIFVNDPESGLMWRVDVRHISYEDNISNNHQILNIHQVCGDDFNGIILYKSYRHYKTIFQMIYGFSGNLVHLNICNDDIRTMFTYRNDDIISCHHYKNEFLHSVDGPAIITYDDDGCITDNQWYINGLYIGRDIMPYWPLTKDQQVEFKFNYL